MGSPAVVWWSWRSWGGHCDLVGLYIGLTIMVCCGVVGGGDHHGLVGLEVRVTITVWWGWRNWGNHHGLVGLEELG